MKTNNSGFKKYLAGILCLIIVVAIFGSIGSKMGLPNMLNTIMKTAHDRILPYGYLCYHRCFGSYLR